jgi:anti-sigma-K factor RskA
LWCAGIAGVALFTAIHLGITPTGAAPVPTHAARVLSVDQEVVVIAAYVDNGGRFLVEPTPQMLAGVTNIAVWMIVETDAPMFVGFMPGASALFDVELPRHLRGKIANAVLVMSAEAQSNAPLSVPAHPFLGGA